MSIKKSLTIVFDLVFTPILTETYKICNRYAKVPKKKAWEFGFKKGNKKHWSKYKNKSVDSLLIKFVSPLLTTILPIHI